MSTVLPEPEPAKITLCREATASTRASAAAERALGVEHAGGGPAQHHLPVAPAGEVTVRGSGDGDHRFDRVGAGQRLRGGAGDAEAGDGEQLRQTLPQGGGRAGVLALQRRGEGLGVTQPGRGVRVVQRTHELGVDPAALVLGQMLGDVPSLVDSATLDRCVGNENSGHRRRQDLGAVDDDQQPIGRVQPAADQVGAQVPRHGLVLRGAFPQP